MSEINLFERFPNLRPITTPPSLVVSWTGWGGYLFGARDYDRATNTYVVTYALCLFGVLPVFALGAYRVERIDQNKWRFYGQVPLSRRVKLLNLFPIGFGITIFSLAIWIGYQSTPGYQAQQQLAQVEPMMADGRTESAVFLLDQLSSGETAIASQARNRLIELVQHPPHDPQQLLAVYRAAVQLAERHRSPVADLYGGGLQVRQLTATDPRGALQLLELLTPIAPKESPPTSERHALFQTLVTHDPTRADYAIELAKLRMAADPQADVESLLLPFVNTREGIEANPLLARMYARHQRWADAAARFSPIVMSRFFILAAVEEEYQKQLNEAQQWVRTQIRHRRFNDFDYNAYNRSTVEQKTELVLQLIADQPHDFPALEKCKAQLEECRPDAQLILEAVAVYLQLAKQATDPPSRQRHAEMAAEALQRIRRLVSKTKQYQLALGQSYFWRGQTTQSEQVFEALLKTKRPAFMFEVATTWNELGVPARAGAVAESAYQLETDPAQKQRIAWFRAQLSRQSDERLLWLGRADLTNPEVNAQWLAEQGEQALLQGQAAAAATHLRQAVANYTQLPSTALNQGRAGVLQLKLGLISAEPTVVAQGVETLDQSLALEPRNVTLLRQSVRWLPLLAQIELSQGKVPAHLVWTAGALDPLAFLARDGRQLRELHVRWADHAWSGKAEQRAQQLLRVVATDPLGWTLIGKWVRARGQIGVLQQTLTQLRATPPDLREYRQAQRDDWGGKDEANRLADAQTQLKGTTTRLAQTRSAAPAALACAIGQHVAAHLQLVAFNRPVDLDALVKLAEEAQQIAPSVGSRETLRSVLRQRVHQRLVQQYPEYAKLNQTTRRSVGAWLWCDLLARYDAWSEVLLADADVQRLQKFAQDDWAADSDHPQWGDWPVLRGLANDLPARWADRANADRAGQLQAELQWQLTPLDPILCLERSWFLRATGKPAEADQLLRQARAEGLPMPN